MKRFCATIKPGEKVIKGVMVCSSNSYTTASPYREAHDNIHLCSWRLVFELQQIHCFKIYLWELILEGFRERHIQNSQHLLLLSLLTTAVALHDIQIIPMSKIKQ